ncbi:GNAT family N-acetyltransferase [Frondihabitans cladoniiphilus]|uniref:GNAT family N-acetyltransferase n=1 Tax=Frondihabitans cladoniiphilus TaxID=715785 RepID=A0ABP8W2S8_9MICO
MPDISIVERPWNDPAGAGLRAEQQAEIAIRHATVGFDPGPKPSADDIAVFLLALVDGKPVGCGALRPFPPGLDGTPPLADAELRRMFVRARNRGTGVAVAILRRLEDEARTRGWNRLVLETGATQVDAVRFYEREGFTRIPNFGPYAGHPEFVCLENTLA